MFRKLLLSTVALVAVSGTAFAADLPSRSAPPVYIPPPPVFSWTGIYIGGQVGYQWGSTPNVGTYFSPALGGAFITNAPGYNSSGIVGGGHLGYNLQFSQFVVGLEGDFEGSGYNGSNAIAGFGGIPFSYSTRETLEGSLRGRAGVAWDRALFYATGGLAIGDINNRYTTTVLGTNFTDSDYHTRLGWTVGGGVEYAVTNNWSIRAEYRYTDYGSYFNQAPISSLGAFQYRVHDFDNKVEVGFSYKFGEPPAPAPVIAKY